MSEPSVGEYLVGLYDGAPACGGLLARDIDLAIARAVEAEREACAAMLRLEAERGFEGEGLSDAFRSALLDAADLLAARGPCLPPPAAEGELERLRAVERAARRMLGLNHPGNLTSDAGREAWHALYDALALTPPR